MLLRWVWYLSRFHISARETRSNWQVEDSKIPANHASMAFQSTPLSVQKQKIKKTNKRRNVQLFQDKQPSSFWVFWESESGRLYTNVPCYVTHIHTHVQKLVWGWPRTWLDVRQEGVTSVRRRWSWWELWKTTCRRPIGESLDWATTSAMCVRLLANFVEKFYHSRGWELTQKINMGWG